MIEGIMANAVTCGVARYCGMQPTRFRVGGNFPLQKHLECVTVVSDPYTGHVLYVFDYQRLANLEKFQQALGSRNKAAIATVSTELWPHDITNRRL